MQYIHAIVENEKFKPFVTHVSDDTKILMKRYVNKFTNTILQDLKGTNGRIQYIEGNSLTTSLGRKDAILIMGTYNYQHYPYEILYEPRKYKQYKGLLAYSPPTYSFFEQYDYVLSKKQFSDLLTICDTLEEFDTLIIKTALKVNITMI